MWFAFPLSYFRIGHYPHPTEAHMSFRESLSKLEHKDNPTGDFANDARRANMPDLSSLMELESHLARRGVDNDVLRIGKRLWKRYEAQRND